MSSNRTDLEARPPSYITAAQYAPNTHTSPSPSPSPPTTAPAPAHSTSSPPGISTMSTATVAAGYLSPLKRKRDEAPDALWRYDDDDRDGVVAGVGLARQLEELSLAVFRGTGKEDMAAQVARRPIRKMRIVATAIANTSATMAATATAEAGELGELDTEAVMGGGCGNGGGDGDGDGEGDCDGERPPGEPEGGGGGAAEWVRVDEPPLNTAMPVGDDEMEDTRNRSHNRISGHSSSSSSSRSNTKRARLRSPPLSRMDTDSPESESEDVDSDMENQQQRGIGYRQTPTQRYVRSQKRMQQIKEYKARVSKEARESRRRRRSFPERGRGRGEGEEEEEGGNDGGGGGEGGEGGGGGAEERGRSARKTVQFKIDME